ncbi:hypothetical protein [Tenacibaculum aiptasiae]|uniref:hypothetical protein n=1 Tax=Tenacibaculum aiptasiae TaxID=426481 RepID=UPI003B5BB727
MNLKKNTLLKSKYVLVNLKFNNDLKLEIYYSFKEDIICLIDNNKLEIKEFKGFLVFSNYLNNTYDFELDFKDKYNEFIPFNTIYLRHNLCLNESLLLNIEASSNEYLKKFNLLFGVDVSPYNRISDKDLRQINNVMQNVIDKDYSQIAKYEIPILIFVGEYFKHKHGSKWQLLRATNDFGNSFVVPYIKVNEKDLQLSREIFRYLNHPKLENGDEKFRFSYFLDLDFIATQSLIKTKKEG